MRVIRFNGKLVVFKEAEWKSIVARFDWEKRVYCGDRGFIRSNGCILCHVYGDLMGRCGKCPLDQFKIEVVGCHDNPGCSVAIDTLLEQRQLGVIRFSASTITVGWDVCNEAIARDQIRIIHAYLLSMDSVTYQQFKLMRRSK